MVYQSKKGSVQYLPSLIISAIFMLALVGEHPVVAIFFLERLQVLDHDVPMFVQYKADLIYQYLMLIYHGGFPPSASFGDLNAICNSIHTPSYEMELQIVSYNFILTSAYIILVLVCL